MEYPKYAKVGDKKYKINTDFRVALECNKISQDATIGDYERALAIIYKLFGKEGLDAKDDYNELSKLATKYLNCGKELSASNETPDMDYEEDEGYIRSSFQFDYKYDPYEQDYCHWWKYYNDLCNLSNSDVGSCCVLNRVRNLRNLDLSKIKDIKDREKMRKAKESVALKRYSKQNNLTQEQEKSMEKLNRILGL